MKVAELEGAELDYWVAKATGRKAEIIAEGGCYLIAQPETETPYGAALEGRSDFYPCPTCKGERVISDGRER